MTALRSATPGSGSLPIIGSCMGWSARTKRELARQRWQHGADDANATAAVVQELLTQAGKPTSTY